MGKAEIKVEGIIINVDVRDMSKDHDTTVNTLIQKGDVLETVVSYLVKYDDGMITCSEFIYMIRDWNKQPFKTGDIVYVNGHLRDVKYLDKLTNTWVFKGISVAIKTIELDYNYVLNRTKEHYKKLDIPNHVLESAMDTWYHDNYQR